MEKFLDRIELLVYYIHNIFLYAASMTNSALRGHCFLFIKKARIRILYKIQINT